MLIEAWPAKKGAVQCNKMHVLIVTYHAPTPEAADAGPLLSGRVSQVSTMTLDALIPRIGDVPLEYAVQRACSMAFTFARHVEAHEIWRDGYRLWPNHGAHV